MFFPTNDLEAPYQDACAREQVYRNIEQTEYDAIWREFTDELVVDNYIFDHEPENLLKDIIHKIALSKENLAVVDGDAIAPDFSKQYIKAAAFDAILSKIEMEVEKYAAFRAQRIYER
jgi:hypothetical protein